MIEQILSSKICLKCRGCCRFSRADSVWAPALLNEDIQELLQNNIPPALISLEKKIRLIHDAKQDNFVCAFFDTDTHQCKVYAFRPFECQLYPFLINRKGKKVFLACDLKCPFVQETLNSQRFKKHARYLAKWLNSPAQIKTLKDNPQIIQEYAEVLEIAELKA